MSATYNWAYRPGINNKYNFNIPVTADNVRPSGFIYVALFGNDVTGNGSRQYPYRTMVKARTTSSTDFLILGSGVYRENSNNINFLIGDGDVIIDQSFVNSQVGSVNVNYFNIKFIGSGITLIGGTGGAVIYTDCTFQYCRPDVNDATFTNCIFNNCAGTINLNSAGLITKNCTFYKCTDLKFSMNTSAIAKYFNIFQECNIAVTTAFFNVTYSLFYRCNFRFDGDWGGGVLYPLTPIGYNYYSDLVTLKAAYASAFPSTINPLVGCTVSDPLFNNLSINDFTLAFDSPAKNLSYFGTYVGCKSIGYPIKVRSAEVSGNFEFSSAVNIVIADDSITLIDPAFNAQIDTNVITNTIGRELANFPSYGFNSDRNGQYIDSIADLDSLTKSTSDTLTVGVPYLVENGAIVYNGETYQPGQRFTTVVGQTTFTSVTSGVLREILEAPQRHTIMVRFSDGGANIPSGTALAVDNYYYVVSGTIIYNAVNYNSGSVFKAIDTNAFSGSGVVIIAFSNESFQHYEPGIKPMSNNTDDLRTGSIIRGNGDPAYVRGGIGIKEFPINATFIQIRYIIRINNLKP